MPERSRALCGLTRPPPSMHFGYSDVSNDKGMQEDSSWSRVLWAFLLGRGSYSATQWRSWGIGRRGLREALGVFVTDLVNQMGTVPPCTHTISQPKLSSPGTKKICKTS